LPTSPPCRCQTQIRFTAPTARSASSGGRDVRRQSGKWRGPQARRSRFPMPSTATTAVPERRAGRANSRAVAQTWPLPPAGHLHQRRGSTWPSGQIAAVAERRRDARRGQPGQSRQTARAGTLELIVWVSTSRRSFTQHPGGLPRRRRPIAARACRDRVRRPVRACCCEVVMLARRAASGPSPRPGRAADRTGRGRSALWRVAGCRASVRRA
jgi:hypothetical protein